MEKLTLDKRLLTIAGLVRKDAYLCDVGTDHAYLPCYLVMKKITSHCLACDINQKPLNAARMHIAELALTPQIQTLLSDGLREIPPEVEDIVIAGMGGELIARIILECDFTKNPNKRFILQPMTQAEFLRKALYENGFEISEEKPVIDNVHYYTVMHVAYTGKLAEIDDVFALIGKIPQQNTKTAKLYISHHYDKLIKIAEGLEKSNSKKIRAEQYRQLASKIQIVLEGKTWQQ